MPADTVVPARAEVVVGVVVRDPGRWIRTRQGWVLLALALVVVAAITGYLTIGVKGSWSFALELRSRRVAAMAVTGVAVASSTVLFQTVTNNRILTPSVMGFDSLYVLIQTLTVYFFGSLTLVRLDERVLFALEVTLMVTFAWVLHRLLFGRRGRDLYVLVLVGIVLGTLFSSVSSLASRMIDPNDFITLQDRLFARFGSVDDDLLVLCTCITAAALAYGWRMIRHLDVVALGREHAIALGVDHRAVVNRALVLVAVLVSTATALVGPITFLGLLVANLARQLAGALPHRVLVPAAALLGVLALVAGQVVLERVFAFDTSLVVIINFVGGIYFLGLLLAEGRRR